MATIKVSCGDENPGPETVMIKLAIAGASGRMGCALIHATARTEGVRVSAALEHGAHASLGKDAGEVAGCGNIGVALSADADAGEFDLMVEFTTPAATLEHLDICRRLRRGMVIGTTGIDAAGKARIRRAGDDIPIVLAANTSVGINLCLALVETAAGVLGPLNDIEVVEAHHRHKVDAPSGTALLLAQAAATPLGKDPVKDGVFTRHGHTGARKSGTIGFSTIRGGDIAGEHTVMFIGDSERIEITHRAGDRRIFADGAIKAAQWLATRPPGLYTMRDVLGLHGTNQKV